MQQKVLVSGVTLLCLFLYGWLLVSLAKAKGDIEVRVYPKREVENAETWSERLRSSLEDAGYDVRSVELKGGFDHSGRWERQWVVLRVRPDRAQLCAWAQGMGETLFRDPHCHHVSYWGDLPDDVHPDPPGPSRYALIDRGWEAWLDVDYHIESPNVPWRGQVQDLQQQLSAIAKQYNFTIGENDVWGPRYQLNQHPEKYRIVVRVRLLPTGQDTVHPFRFGPLDREQWENVVSITRPGISCRYVDFDYDHRRFGWRRH